MKIDKSNPRHWLYLLLASINVAAALVLRPFWRRRRQRAPRPTVLLYGHKLGGNLLAIYRLLRRENREEVAFLTLDPEYHRALRARGESVCLAVSPACIAWLARARVLISDHGLHMLEPLVGRADLRFFDTWHGIPFKGFDADDFRVQRRYDEAWVASPLHRRLYLERFGFEPSRVQVTGYARTDRLVDGSADPVAIRRDFDLARFGDRRLVLFAPTWKQDATSRSLYPFDLAEEQFLAALAGACARHDAVLLVRKHLNSGRSDRPAPDNVAWVPFAEFPDTEALLLVSDLLICDWSSIAFDFLLLDRPTIFLDVEPPFRKGFSLGPEYRFGAVVGGMDGLLARVEAFLADPASYAREFGATAQRMKEVIYAGMADGRSSARCVARLR